MKHMTALAAIIAASFAVAAPAAAQNANYSYDRQSQDEEARFEAAQRRYDGEYRTFQEALERYKRSRDTRTSNRDPRYDDRYDDENWDPAGQYRAGNNYQERVLRTDERVYRGNDGRYYCRRSDGTTGLIVGAAAGGLFGNVIAGRRSSTVGTLLGAIAGGAIGSAADRNQVRCR